MNKMKKLLSVVLAVVLAFSALTVLGSAAKTAYKTVDELTALAAYSPYGQVTRLSTEERTSIVFDALDNLLASANINMGEVFNVMGLSVTIDLTSIDRLCYSLDTIDSTFSNLLFSIAKAIVNLGILEDVSFSTWDKNDMTRDTYDQVTILGEVLELLSNNGDVVYTVINNGTLDLGIISLGDMSAIEDIIGDLPGLVKGMLFPMMERKDDTTAEVQALDTAMKGDGNVESIVNDFVKNLFTDNRSTTTVKADSTGKMTSKHTGMPTAEGTRFYYVQNGTTLTAYRYVDAAEAEASTKDTDETNDLTAYTYVEDAVYTLTQEVAGDPDSDYVWTATDDWGNKWNLKYYEDDSKWLPSLTAEIDLSTMSLADLLYTMVPVVFRDMAPVVLNGSMKKILGGLFGARYTYVGQVGDDAVNALPDSSDAFFTQEQGEYLWEWSDYAVINGNHYYRFEDQIFSCDISNTNPYFNVINWDYEITGDFMDEFVPANGGSTSDTLLMNTNDFLIKVAKTVFSSEILDKVTLTSGGNENLVANIKTVAQTFIKHDPASIFGSDYATNDRCYYNLLISDNNDTVLTGIAAQLVDMIMPSMTLPGASALVASNAKVGAILAAVIREFAAQLVPEYNYDALIYADFGTTTDDPDKTFVDPEAAGLLTDGQTASGYWLDVILTIGMDVGFEYIRAFADMGEDTTAWTNGVVGVGYAVDGKTYAAGTTQATLNAQWEGLLDYVVDWALEFDYEWSWKFEKLVNTTGLTIDLASAQDPWVKLDQILNSLLPADEILNVTATDCETELEQLLRYDFILAIVDLRWEDLINVLAIPEGFVRTDNVLDSLATVLKNLINGIFAKVGNTSGNFEFIPAAITDFDTLANQANLATMLKNIVGAIYTAAITNNGWDVIAPFLNFLLGWKTDPQKIADLVVWTSFRDNNDYAFQWTGNGVYPTMDADVTLIKILNNSAGMLETHRNSSVTDHSYDINIKSVTSDATVNTLTFTYDSVVSPYETVDIKIGGTYNGEEAVTVVIEYDYVGKDGAAVGGTQYKSITFLVSHQYEDSNIEGRADGDDSDGKAGIDPFKKYQFTEDIYTTVTTFEPSIWGTNETLGGTSNYKWTNAPDPVTRDCDGNITDSSSAIDMTGNAATYFDYYQNQDGGWGDSFPKDGSTSGKLYKAASGVTEETEFPYGVYDMGQVGVKYGDDTKVWNIDYIYYNDYDIDLMWADYKDKGITKYDVDTTDSAAVAAYDAYNTALKKVAYLATYPMMTEANGNSATDYVNVIMPQIEPAKEALEAAYEALEAYMADAQGAAGADAALPTYVQDLEAQLATDDGDGEKEINYTDYEFYEYFNYADLRTEARNLVKTYYAPEIMDTYYILNSGIREAELNNVIAAESNAAIAAGIAASRMENDADAIAASITARNDWQQPINSELFVDDLTSRLAYYKQFLIKENDDHLYFLNQEIAHVEAQQFVEDDYTADSWAEYTKRLEEAKAIAASAATDGTVECNSDIFTAKWHLMVARKNLLLKANSLIEAGGTADLMANRAIADEIFASLGAQDGAWAVKEGVDANTAFAQLISALGYYYTGEDGNEWNLYADSALEYIDNDRPNRTTNQAKVNAANTALEAAIANFEQTAKEPNTIMLKDGAPYEAVIDTTNCGDYLGTIYGIDTLGWDDTLEADGTLADFLTTAYGDDYLEIVVGDAGVETTGTIINVLDEDGNAIETYVFVYFGDVDMDGLVGASDATICEYYEGYYEGIDTFEQFMAADLDNDGWPGASDAAYMEYYEGYYEGMPEQSVVAAGIVESGLVYEMV